MMPTQDLQERLGVHLILLARLYRRAVDSAVKQYNLSEATILPLRYVARLGGVMRQGLLADLLNLEGPTLTRVLDQLVDQGYVDRVEDEADRRVKIVQLTDAGRELNAALDTILKSLRSELFAEIDNDDAEATLRVLAQLDVNLQRHRDR